MRYTNVIHEDFANYHKPAMFIGTISCDGKCWRELGLPSDTCQNDALRSAYVREIDTFTLVEKYINNQITEAVVFGGLEPMLQIDEVLKFIYILRNTFNNNDDVVIYTGYYPDELVDELNELRKFENIVVKFGRYIPDDKPKYDDVLMVTLSSSNQYAERIS